MLWILDTWHWPNSISKVSPKGKFSLHQTKILYLLKCTNKTFDIIAVSETRISKKTFVISDVNLDNYSFESTLTEPSAGGVMLYVSNHLSYKPRTDLNMCKKIN